MTTNTLKDSIIVFLGPTLNIANAKKINPNAIFLPPIQCGDIYSLFRLGTPKAIGIVDGYFETVPSIWHKEILYAIHNGCHVVGAGSMGALRAAELEPLGMHGIGKIFQAFKTKVYRDDGEVAVVHGPSEFKYPVLTDALVNIRATVAKALDEKIINAKLGGEIIDRAINTFYQKRKLELITSSMPQTKELERFNKWTFHENGYVDQKALDATELLSYFNNSDFTDLATEQKNVQPIWTGWTSTLFRYVSCRPIQIKADWLSPEEKIAQISRLFGRKYFLARKFAIGMSYVHATTNKDTIIETKNDEWLNIITSGKDHDSWFEQNDISDVEDFKERYSKIFASISNATSQQIENCKNLSRFFGLYKPDMEFKTSALILLGYLGDKLTNDFNKFGYQAPNNQANMFIFSQDYFDFLGLDSQSKLDEWISSNELKNPSEYNDFIKYIFKFERVFDLVNPIYAHQLTGNAENINWYLDAIKISGLYQKIKQGLNKQIDLGTQLKKYWGALTPKHQENQAILADFDNSEEVARLLDAYF